MSYYDNVLVTEVGDIPLLKEVVVSRVGVIVIMEDGTEWSFQRFIEDGKS